MTRCEKIQAGLTVREVTFEEWDPDIVKEEEGVDGDNHDRTNLSAQELSKFALLPLPLKIYYVLQHTFYMDVWLF